MTVVSGSDILIINDADVTPTLTSQVNITTLTEYLSPVIRADITTADISLVDPSIPDPDGYRFINLPLVKALPPLPPGGLTTQQNYNLWLYDSVVSLDEQIGDGPDRLIVAGTGLVTNPADGITGAGTIAVDDTVIRTSSVSGQTISGQLTTANIQANGTVTAAAFVGDGSGLTNVGGGGSTLFTFKGNIDVALQEAPVAAAGGDVWQNTTTGDAKTSWTGIADEEVLADQLVIFQKGPSDPVGTWFKGNILDRGIYLPKTGGTIFGSLSVTENATVSGNLNIGGQILGDVIIQSSLNVPDISAVDVDTNTLSALTGSITNLTVNGNAVIGRITGLITLTSDTIVVNTITGLNDFTSNAGTIGTLQSGNVFSTGTVTAAFFSGDGSQLSGISAEIDIVTGDGLIGGPITDSGTIAVDSTVVRTEGAQTIHGDKTFTGLDKFTRSISVGGAPVDTLSDGNIDASGTVTAAAFVGDGSGLTGVGGGGTANVSITGANGITTTPDTITGTGSVSVDETVVRTEGSQLIGGTKTFSDDITIVGTLTAPNMSGVVTEVNTGYGLEGGPITSEGQLYIDEAVVMVSRGDQTMGGTKSFSGLLKPTNVEASGTITAGAFVGDGSGLTNLPGGPFTFIGQYDATLVAPPVATQGDCVLNTGTGTALGAWVGIAGTQVYKDQLLYFLIPTGMVNGEWTKGNTVDRSIYLPLVGGTITGNLKVDGVLDANLSGLADYATVATTATTATTALNLTRSVLAGSGLIGGGELVNDNVTLSVKNSDGTILVGPTGVSVNPSALDNYFVSINTNQTVGGDKIFTGSITIQGILTAGSVAATSFTGDGSGLYNLNIPISQTGVHEVRSGNGIYVTPLNTTTGEQIVSVDSSVVLTDHDQEITAQKVFTQDVLGPTTTITSSDQAFITKLYFEQQLTAANESGVQQLTAGEGLNGGVITDIGTISVNDAEVVRTTKTQVIGGSKTFNEVLHGITPSHDGDADSIITKEYLDTNAITRINTGSGLQGGPINTTGTITVDTTVVRTTGGQTINGNLNITGVVGSPETVYYGSGANLTDVPIPAQLIFKGNVDVTTNNVPLGLQAGWFYINTVTGYATNEWVGIEGQSILKNQLLYYTDNNYWIPGGIEDNTSYLPSSGGTITGDLVVDDTLTVGGVITGDGSGITNIGGVTLITTGEGLSGGPISTTGELTVNPVEVVMVQSDQIIYGRKQFSEIVKSVLTQNEDNPNTLTTKSYVDEKVSGAGTGTVTEIETGMGLTGGPITGTGTISVNVNEVCLLDGTQTIAGSKTFNRDVLGPNTNSSSSELAFTTKSYVDAKLSLQPAGTVVKIETGTGLLGGPITDEGTIEVDTGTSGVVMRSAITQSIDGQKSFTQDVYGKTTTDNSLTNSLVTKGYILSKIESASSGVTEILTPGGTAVGIPGGISGGPISTTGSLQVDNTVARTNNDGLNGTSGREVFAGEIQATAYIGDGSQLSGLSQVGPLEFKGVVNVTDANEVPPSNPDPGDSYLNSVTGTAGVQWTGIADQTILDGQLVIWIQPLAGGQWIAGAMVDRGTYLMKEGVQTLTGTLNIIKTLDDGLGNLTVEGDINVLETISASGVITAASGVVGNLVGNADSATLAATATLANDSLLLGGKAEAQLQVAKAIEADNAQFLYQDGIPTDAGDLSVSYSASTDLAQTAKVAQKVNVKSLVDEAATFFVDLTTQGTNDATAVSQILTSQDVKYNTVTKEFGSTIVKYLGDISECSGHQGGSGGGEGNEGVVSIAPGPGIITDPTGGIGPNQSGTISVYADQRAGFDNIVVASSGISVDVPKLENVMFLTGQQSASGDKTFTGNINCSQTVTANRFVGDGSGLTNLPVSGPLTFKGVVEVSEPPPENPDSGDTYMNSTEAPAASGWVGLNEATVLQGQLVIWSGTQWALGALVDRDIYLPKSGGTISGNLQVSGQVWVEGNTTLKGPVTVSGGLADFPGPGITSNGDIVVANGYFYEGDGSHLSGIAAGTFVSDTPPDENNASEGDFWWNSADDDGQLYVYYGEYWVPATPTQDALDLENGGTINGDLTVTGQFTASGIRYPLTDGNVGQALVTDGNGNLFWGAGGGSSGGASVTISVEDPLDPTNGDLWWCESDGSLYIYYTDVDSSQWVPATPAPGGSGAAGGGANVTISDSTPPPDPQSGDLWWDSNETSGSLYIYYDEGLGESAQWVSAVPTTGGGGGTVEGYWDKVGNNLSPETIGTNLINLGGAGFGNDVIISPTAPNTEVGVISLRAGGKAQFGHYATATYETLINSSATSAVAIEDGGTPKINLKYDGSATFAGTGSFTGQVTIPTTPVNDTDAASKGYVDTAVAGEDTWDWNDTINMLEPSAQELSDGSAVPGNTIGIRVGSRDDTSATDWQGVDFSAAGDVWSHGGGFHVINEPVDAETVPTVSIQPDGSAEFAGQILSGGDPNDGANLGAKLVNTGTIQACRASGSDALFTGFTKDTTEPTVRINANGSANFAGNTLQIASSGDLGVSFAGTTTFGSAVNLSSSGNIVAAGDITASGNIFADGYVSPTTGVYTGAAGTNGVGAVLTGAGAFTLLNAADDTSDFINCWHGTTAAANRKFQVTGDGNITAAGTMSIGDPAGNSFAQGMVMDSESSDGSYMQVYCVSGQVNNPLSIYRSDHTTAFKVTADGEITSEGKLTMGRSTSGTYAIGLTSVLSDSGNAYIVPHWDYANTGGPIGAAPYLGSNLAGHMPFRGVYTDFVEITSSINFTNVNGQITGAGGAASNYLFMGTGDAQSIRFYTGAGSSGSAVGTIEAAAFVDYNGYSLEKSKTALQAIKTAALDSNTDLAGLKAAIVAALADH